jgi:multidrug efflux system membrane fusion protein
MRPVVTGLSLNDHTVVQQGVDAGDVVVTEGQLRLVSGAKVSIRQQAAAATQDSGS